VRALRTVSHAAQYSGRPALSQSSFTVNMHSFARHLPLTFTSARGTAAELDRRHDYENERICAGGVTGRRRNRHDRLRSSRQFRCENADRRHDRYHQRHYGHERHVGDQRYRHWDQWNVRHGQRRDRQERFRELRNGYLRNVRYIGNVRIRHIRHWRHAAAEVTARRHCCSRGTGPGFGTCRLLRRSLRPGRPPASRWRPTLYVTDRHRHTLASGSRPAAGFRPA
jgi:hypothetical protein